MGNKYPSYRFAPNIKVPPAADGLYKSGFDYKRFENSIMATLDDIWQGSWTGTSVIQGIAEKSGIDVLITPYLDGYCNADANPFPAWASNHEICIRYLPATWAPGSPCARGPGATPDAALLHELVHAYRMVNGYVDKYTLNVPGFFYENEEEFYAILLTNIHLSAKGERELRKDHKFHQVLYPELSTSKPFLTHYREHRDLVARFLAYRNHYGLCQNHIRKDQCRFNPIDYYLKNSAAMVELSKRKAAAPNPHDLAAKKLQEEELDNLMKKQMQRQQPPKSRAPAKH